VGLLLGRRSYRGRETAVLVLAGVAVGAGLGGMALAPTFWVAAAALLVVGGANLAFQTTSQSLLLGLADMSYHGRIQGLVMLSFGAFGIAALPLGVLADAIGLRWTFAGMGLGVLAVVAVFAFTVRRRVAAADRLRDVG
jgi:predicted MFS family arabinose efflux permease